MFVFPCATLHDADTFSTFDIFMEVQIIVTCLAFAKVDELIDFIKSNALKTNNEK